MLNVAHLLDATARRNPDGLAIVHNSQRISFVDLQRYSNQVANGLASFGLTSGDTVALCCPNWAAFPIVYFGVLKLGARLVTLSPSLRGRDLARQLIDSDARALFYGNLDADLVADAVHAVSTAPHCEQVWLLDRDTLSRSTKTGLPMLADLTDGRSTSATTACYPPDKSALVIYSSGTTGPQKGVEITQQNLLSMILINISLHQEGVGKVRITSSPLFGIMGQMCGFLVPIFSGETIVLAERQDPELVWQLLVQESGTYLLAMPHFYRHLLDVGAKFDTKRIRSSLRLCSTGGAPLPPAWSEEFEDRYGQPLLCGYGATEVTSILSWHTKGDPIIPGTVGRAAPGVQIKIANEQGDSLPPGSAGEIWASSPGLMKGYLGNTAATKEALCGRFYKTRDIGLVTEEGYVQLIGRKDGKIIRGVDHVYPAEVEEVLQQHPSVSLAAVFGVPDGHLGEKVCVLVVPNPEIPVGSQSLLSWTKAQLPSDKWPDEVRFCAELPTTPSGKVVSAELPSRWTA